MNPHMARQLASQHEADLRALAARGSHTRQARQVAQRHGHRRAIRRRAGWALVSLGMRLACTPGEQ
ncbi:MAG TPA: hypothetical protein VKS82_04560 [Streptosporangiaceae bacterium]|jgi:hypothetical protein|nr:hypothetical protein [Streptosporangiaceae bacterium]